MSGLVEAISGDASAPRSRQLPGASAYARKTTPPARASRRPRRPGLVERQPTIIHAAGLATPSLSKRRRRGSERLRRGFRNGRNALAASRQGPDVTSPRYFQAAPCAERTATQGYGTILTTVPALGDTEKLVT